MCRQFVVSELFKDSPLLPEHHDVLAEHKRHSFVGDNKDRLHVHKPLNTKCSRVYKVTRPEESSFCSLFGKFKKAVSMLLLQFEAEW